MAGGWRETGRGVAIQVRLTPRSGADRIEGLRTAADGSVTLAARVRAAPEKGAANAALEALLAERLGVARSEVAVGGGHKSRVKTVEVARPAADLRAALDEIGSRDRDSQG